MRCRVRPAPRPGGAPARRLSRTRGPGGVCGCVMARAGWGGAGRCVEELEGAVVQQAADPGLDRFIETGEGGVELPPGMVPEPAQQVLELEESEEEEEEAAAEGGGAEEEEAEAAVEGAGGGVEGRRGYPGAGTKRAAEPRAGHADARVPRPRTRSAGTA